LPVRPSVRLSVPNGLLSREQIGAKTKLRENLPRDKSNRCANFQPKVSQRSGSGLWLRRSGRAAAQCVGTGPTYRNICIGGIQVWFMLYVHVSIAGSRLDCWSARNRVASMSERLTRPLRLWQLVPDVSEGACWTAAGARAVEDPCDVAFVGPYTVVVADSVGHRLLLVDIARDVWTAVADRQVWPNGVAVTDDGKLLVTDRLTKVRYLYLNS